MQVLKVQTTLRGYSAWVVQQMMAIKGESLADITKYLFDRWSDDDQEFLAGFGLTREVYRNSEEANRKVVAMADHTDAR